MEKGRKKAPVNTSQVTKENPRIFLEHAAILGGSGATLNQEAVGQRSFVGSDTLPTDMGRYSKYDTKTILEAAGVKFLGVVEGDEMFQYVELPKGWKKVPTDHSMWSKLLDDKGRERAAIFYKAAFYDRSAHMLLTRRFGVSFDYDRLDKEGVGVANITDGGKVIYTTEPIPGKGKQIYEVSDEANKSAKKWLDKNHPDWQNPGAYWN